MEFTDYEIGTARAIAKRFGRTTFTMSAEDILSDIFLLICEKYDKVEKYRTEEGGKGKYYFFILHSVFTLLKKDSELTHRQHNYNNLVHDSSYTTERIIEAIKKINTDYSDEDTAIIHSALLSLPTKHRVLLMQAYYEDKTNAMLAEEYGKTLGRVRRNKNNAMTELKQILSGYKLRFVADKLS